MKKIAKNSEYGYVILRENGSSIGYINRNDKSGVWVTGYHYIFPTKKCAQIDCNKINESWKEKCFVAKVKLVLVTSK